MSAYFSSDDEDWDEERWEAFLRDHDKRVDRYMELMFRFMRKNPQPDLEDTAALTAWKASLREWLRDKGWRHDDIFLPFLWLEEQAEEDQDDDGDVFASPLPFADEETEDDTFEALERLPVYQQACQLSVEVLDWAHALSGEVKDIGLVHFCSHVAQAPANLARGYGLGHERDTIGGNIACAKRGLSDANAALAILSRMKRAPYMDGPTYRRFYEQVYEVRNAIALYIQDLRDQFNLGVD